MFSRLTGSVTLLLGAGLLLMGCDARPSGRVVSEPAPAPRRPAPPGAPNVLLITLDTVRRDHFGCYGDTRGITPHFDALAQDGVRFERAYSTAAATPMAHASILTGLNNYEHKVRVIAGAGGFRLPADIPTAATVLREAGWNTAAFLSAFPVSEYYGLHRGFDHWDNGLSGAAGEVFRPDAGDNKLRWDIGAHQRRSDVTTDRFLEWLAKAEPPVFVWIHYWDPHDLLILPPQGVLDRFPPKTVTPVDRARSIYAAELAYVDQQFGRVVQALRERGWYDNTAVAVISDHGEGLGDHDWYHHRLLYDEQIHVPFLLRLPSGPRGVGVGELVRATDWYPTMLDYLRQAAPRPTFGRTLRPLIEGQADEPRVAYADQLNKFDLNSNIQRQRPKDGLIYSIVSGDWKLIYNDEHPGEHQLYRLSTDPRERENLFSGEPEKAAELITLLEGLAPFQREPFKSDGALDPEAYRALKALGYIDDGSPSAPAERP